MCVGGREVLLVIFEFSLLTCRGGGGWTGSGLIIWQGYG